MSNLSLTPFREMLSLRDSINRMFDDPFFRPLSLNSFVSGQNFAMDVEAKNDEFVIRANVPGLKPEDLHVDVADNTVTVRGEIKDEQKNENSNYLMIERHYGQFSRSVTLPASVTTDKAEATIQNGVLTLRLPKAIEARPKAITVKAK